jgi:hypothetical protein
MLRQFGKITAFEELMAKRYSPQSLVGRAWLVDYVDAFRQNSTIPHLVITGEPGWGKSAFIAHLAELWNCPRYFIRADSLSGTTGLAAKPFLISLGAQLYQKYGRDIFVREILGSADVRAAWTRENAQVIGRVIEKLYSLPFLPIRPTDVRLVSGIAGSGSGVIGEQIRELHDITLSLDEVTLLHAVVLEPLVRLFEADPTERVVILIDALDEAPQTPSSILDVIPRLSDAELPKNLKLVMTSRPGVHLLPFSGALSIDVSKRSDPFSDHNRADARAYIRQQVDQAKLKTAISSWNRTELAHFVNRVDTRAQGNFLYLTHFFQEASTVVDQGGDLRSLTIPKGLDDIYRMFAVQKIKENTSLHEWVQYYLPLLGTLASFASQLHARPLPVLHAFKSIMSTIY